MLSKLLFKIGQQLRNPSLDAWFVFLKKSEKWTLEELETYQFQQLKEIVTIAYNNSDFYKNLFDDAAIKPSDIKTLEDLQRIPTISKGDLLKFNNQIHTNKSFKKVFKAGTSGTSGISLKFNREESTDSFNRASIFRGYSWYQVKPWEYNGYFWGFNFKGFSKLKTKFLDFLQNRFRLFSYNSKDLKTFHKKLEKASYLHGYSSMIYEVAKYINATNISKPVNLKMVKGTSEKILDAYQHEVKKAFGLKIISEYGAAETGIIAFECPQGNMHINVEGVLVEEENHEIIVTNLQLKSFPIIRYRLGDYIRLAPKEKKCSCGLQHPILEEVTGRIGSVVYGKSQRYPSLYFYYIFKNLAKKGLTLTYQVQQNTKGELLFLIAEPLATKELVLLKHEINSYFKNDIDYRFGVLKSEPNKNKKTQSFISTIA